METKNVLEMNKFERPILGFIDHMHHHIGSFAVLSDKSELYKTQKKLFGSKKTKVLPYEECMMITGDDNDPLWGFITGVSCIEHEINHSCNEDLMKLVIDFCKFLRTVEKLFLYNNDEYCYVYSEIMDKTWLLFLRSEENEYKIRIKIEKTKIDNLLDDESNIEKLFFDNSKLVLVTIDIVREYGKKMVTTFKYPLGSTPQFNDASDEVLFELAENIIKNKLIECYFSIIESTFKILGIKNLSENTTYWENMKKNGLYWYLEKELD